jgi:diadenosine tetraphosphate (Ap4A) HIT family hydrolase
MDRSEVLAQPRPLDDSTCVFCRALEEPANPDMRPIYNTHLGSSERFVILPALGPLVRGHVLVVSRAHLPSLASMGPRAIQEFEDVGEQVRANYASVGTNLLEAEHGATLADTGGGCIAHTHINLIPELGHLHNILSGILQLLDVPPPLTNLSTVQLPYILMKRGDSFAIYDATQVPSQLVRRVVCRYLGREDWDWAAFPRHNLVNDTIDLWKAI